MNEDIEEEIPDWNDLNKSARLFHDPSLDWSNSGSIRKILEEFADDEEKGSEEV